MAEPVGPPLEHASAQEPSPAGREEVARESTVPSSPEKHAAHPAADAAAPFLNPAPGSVSSFDAVAELWSRVADVDPIVYYWEEPAETRRRVVKESREESAPFLPGRRPIYKRAEPLLRAEDELANVIAFLQKLRVNVRRTESPGEGSSPTEPGQSVLQAKRLTRTGVSPAPFQAGVPPRSWSAPRIEADPEAPEAAPRPAPLPAAPPAAESVRPPRPHAVWLVLMGVFALAALCLAASLWTRDGSSSRADPVPGAAATRAKAARAQMAAPSQEALNLVNLALDATQRGDLKKATDLLDDARKQGTGLSGCFYQSALLAFSQEQAEQADGFLRQSIEANEFVAECWYLRANASFSAAGPDKAAEDFEQAIYAAPFSPRYYFFRAECLRRNGNTTAALGQFQQALRCRPSSADTELIQFKIGLTRLEASADLPFRTELRDRLSREPVAGDALLLAAADAISCSEYAEAAADLKRAALVLPPRVFQSRVRDYIFQAQAQQPDLAPVLKPLLPTNPPSPPVQRAAKVIIDPSTRSLGEADPAGW